MRRLYVHICKQDHMEVLEQSIKNSPVGNRERFFQDLYEETFPAFARFAAKMNASFQDAKDLFQDALVIYYERSMEENFRLRSSREAYILGIARNLWLKKFHRDRYLSSLDSVDEAAVPQDYFPSENESRLLEFVERTGKKCLELLHQFYFERSSLKRIASALGYRTEHSAAVQKFKCIGKVRDAIKEKSLRYEDFHF